MNPYGGFTGEDLGQLGIEPDLISVTIRSIYVNNHLDTLVLHLFVPCLVELARLGENHHRGQITRQTLLVDLVPHAVGWRCVESFHHDGWQIGCGVTRSQEEGESGHQLCHLIC